MASPGCKIGAPPPAHNNPYMTNQTAVSTGAPAHADPLRRMRRESVYVLTGFPIALVPFSVLIVGLCMSLGGVILVAGRGVGYLLKDRVQDLDTLEDALTRVAGGGSVLPPGARGATAGPPTLGHVTGEPVTPRAGRARAHGGGSIQQRDRTTAGGLAWRRGKARLGYFQQPRPGGLRRRSPSSAGRARLAAWRAELIRSLKDGASA
jgi:hypothetical protein